jgi:hypothetical protein
MPMAQVQTHCPNDISLQGHFFGNLVEALMTKIIQIPYISHHKFEITLKNQLHKIQLIKIFPMVPRLCPNFTQSFVF